MPRSDTSQERSLPSFARLMRLLPKVTALPMTSAKSAPAVASKTLTRSPSTPGHSGVLLLDGSAKASLHPFQPSKFRGKRNVGGNRLYAVCNRPGLE